VKGLLLVVLVVAACKDDQSRPPVTQAGATSQGTKIAPEQASPPDAAPRPEPVERDGGPTKDECAKFAEIVTRITGESMNSSTATAEQRAAVQKKLDEDKPNLVRFCVESLTKEEVECVSGATDFVGLTKCERFRRQVPKDLANAKKVTAEHCEQVFLRLKQFKLAEGVPAETIEKDHEKIVAACLKSAKPGTVACFITATSYEEAKRCP
jgi:hypothetical protein